jgi:hypothetical protein
LKAGEALLIQIDLLQNGTITCVQPNAKLRASCYAQLL